MPDRPRSCRPARWRHVTDLPSESPTGHTFATDAEAVAIANASEFGLAAYVQCGSLQRALRLAGAPDAGMVGVNRRMVSDPAAPFGGLKQSGLGREGGREGLLELTETQMFSVDWAAAMQCS